MHTDITCTQGGVPSECVCLLCRPVSLPQVVVAEAGPGYDGHAMASQLSQAKVQTTLIADSAVFAMMARVNKVCGVLLWCWREEVWCVVLCGVRVNMWCV